jgi:hypothetical protein
VPTPHPVLPSGMPIVLEAIGRVLALLGDVVLGGAGVAPALLLVGIPAARGLLGAPRPPARPDEDDDLPVLVSSSDPDADGHERSRAPGRPAQVVVPALRPAA